MTVQNQAELPPKLKKEAEVGREGAREENQAEVARLKEAAVIVLEAQVETENPLKR